jgi:hypothetical protein
LSPVFSRTDTTTNSKWFYITVLDLLEDIEEQEEVNKLLMWWNRYEMTSTLFLLLTNTGFSSQIFPSYSSARQVICKNSVLARIKEKRAETRNAACN